MSANILTDILAFVAPFLSSPSGILTTVLTAAAAWLAPFLANLLKLNADDTRRGYIQDAVKNALAYAVSVVAKNPQGSDLVAVKDDVIAIAKAYLQTTVPEALAALKINDAGLTQLLEAGLATGLDDLSGLLGNLIPRNAAVVAAKASRG